MTEQMYSLHYMAGNNKFSMHILATPKEIAQHAFNLNGTYEPLSGTVQMPSDFYMEGETAHG